MVIVLGIIAVVLGGAIAVMGGLLESAKRDRVSSDFRTIESAHWDEQRGMVVARRERRLNALVLESTELERPAPETLQAGLLAAVGRKGLNALPWDETARQLQVRVSLLRSLWADDWPALDDKALGKSLEQWLPPWLAGLCRWSDIQQLDMVAILSSQLGHERLKQLSELAPTHLSLPDGRRAHLDYCADNPPALWVKLQAMLGCRDTPTIGRGRIPVQLYLLSPADRPLAVTADLASFWKNAYPEVRKDMRGRYPKHSWPTDPLSATPPKGKRARSA